jgi:hypothetical protein
LIGKQPDSTKLHEFWHPHFLSNEPASRNLLDIAQSDICQPNRLLAMQCISAMLRSASSFLQAAEEPKKAPLAFTSLSLRLSGILRMLHVRLALMGTRQADESFRKASIDVRATCALLACYNVV